MPGARRGTTLLELLVVLAILATMASIAGLAFLSRRAPEPTGAIVRLAESRREAIASGRPVPFSYLIDRDSARALALPDGSVIAAAAGNIDRVSGRPLDASR
jgi:prepilin-type N-terminal cleavage/methylation domain-containing protein